MSGEWQVEQNFPLKRFQVDFHWFSNIGEHCHVAKSLSRVSAYSGVCLLKIDLSTSIEIDSNPIDGLIQFEQLLINYTLLIPPNTEKKLEPWIFDFADDVDVWPGLPTIIYALDYRKCINYHRQSRYGAKTFSFLPLKQ
ncbi:hypothetical protein EVAR_80948_1 [Eumeta japonica]|uniref:Uncharacterized protein n=1 Tax=Eumeta variegata TaxID=151549 RepID=A0A4C2AF76_EUMVA|nr:hypothetical protein EVAR_80948_1 [Eumeta japonica]